MHLKFLSMMNATDLQNNIPMNMAVSIEEIKVYKFLSTLTNLQTKLFTIYVFYILM